ncbi:uncharacterized protein Z518_08406 [Rhinocladiella mackenziei CBS 650.93]|uniref:Clathrin adaptor alpha-adaptin appendage C-terminal subdomain domain-containing protein n=1 Tax=Rhinocladiella mackenziei CBS 650.93 TaxID=1442369 RepID=A0A0D2J0Q4_9EURO|nr:uncharacterized protein Z518_08406 [Rhinocladiella mackenziei CBS 650.93]KIX02465.1 hypothetical protein Z518_08406 [Rhinocladiella mackenziei CBS 650.93]
MGRKRTFTTIVNGRAKPSANGTESGHAGGIQNGVTGASEDLEASAAHLSPDWEIGYEQMYFSNRGVLYEDPQIQVASSAIGSFTTTLDNKSAPALKIDTKSLPESHVEADFQVQETIVCTSVAPFSEPPKIRISYLAGALQGYALELPILAHRFMDPSELSSEDFFKRWRQFGAGPLGAQSTFSLKTRRQR